MSKRHPILGFGLGAAAATLIVWGTAWQGKATLPVSCACSPPSPDQPPFADLQEPLISSLLFSSILFYSILFSPFLAHTTMRPCECRRAAGGARLACPDTSTGRVFSVGPAGEPTAGGLAGGAGVGCGCPPGVGAGRVELGGAHRHAGQARGHGEHGSH